jgi:ribonuclease VapC
LRYVLDASALVALILEEPGAGRVADVLADSAISTVNLAEVAGRLAREGLTPQSVDRLLETLPCLILPPERRVALLAGQLVLATRSAGLSLGDRFCLAQAREARSVALTADRQWDKVADKIGVQVELIR